MNAPPTGANRSRRDILALGAAALLGAAEGRAQPAPRVARVTIEERPSLKSREGWVGLFASHGFVEGRNLTLSFADLYAPDPGEAERRAREVIASRPDVIVVPGGTSIALFKRLTREIPIVFYSLGFDPVRMGLVESYRRPGGNVTGTTNQGIEVTAKGWELLKELRPAAKRVGALFDDEYVANDWVPMIREEQMKAASRLGLERVEIVVSPRTGSAPAERAIRDAKVHLLDVSGGYWPWTPELMGFLERAAIPTLWETATFVRKGGLVSLVGSIDEAITESAGIVAAILRGGSPATIPVREVTRIVIAINVRTARAMKITIPQSIVVRADLVVE